MQSDRKRLRLKVENEIKWFRKIGFYLITAMHVRCVCASLGTCGTVAGTIFFLFFFFAVDCFSIRYFLLWPLLLLLSFHSFVIPPEVVLFDRRKLSARRCTTCKWHKCGVQSLVWQISRRRHLRLHFCMLFADFFMIIILRERRRVWVYVGCCC